MRSAIYKSSIAALCGLGSPPAAGFGRLAAVHSTRLVAALYPYSACATWDGSGDQRLRVGWLVGVYARTMQSSVRLQKRYLVGMVLALCDTHQKTTIIKACPQGMAQDAPRDFRAMVGHHILWPGVYTEMNDSQKLSVVRRVAAMRGDAMRVADQAAELAAIYDKNTRAQGAAAHMRAIEIDARDAVKALERMQNVLCCDPADHIWLSFEPVLDAISEGLDCLGGLV